MFTNTKLKEIFVRTDGHCHFCGDELIFEKYGWRPNETEGAWEADHIIQRGKGGSKDAKNCLPACVYCNRLRWHRTGKEIREIIAIGLVAKKLLRKKGEAGKLISNLLEKRQESNKKRRRQLLPVNQ